MRQEIKVRIAMIERGEVPEGYKKHLDRIIPLGWRYSKFNELAEISMGQSPEGESYNSEGVGIPLINGPTEFTSRYPVARQWTTKPTKICNIGDILICVRGSSTGYINISNGKYCIGRGVAAISNKQNCHLQYLEQLLTSIVASLLKLTTGSTFPNLSGNDIKEYEVIFTNEYKEQQQIADVLSTWDRATELKEKLFEQKKLQKKGLMERLLNGKVRLPGFTDEWKYLKAGEIFSNSSNKKHGGVGEVLSSLQDRGIIPRSQVDIDIKYDAESVVTYKKVEVGDFVISLRSFQGGIEYSEYEGLISPAYTVLKSKRDIDTGFYKEFFKSANFIKRLNSVIYGIRDGKQIGYDDFSILRVPYPPKKEQTAIANVLRTATDEISVLQKELSYLKTQKKGLMQLLLTGKVRVPC